MREKKISRANYSSGGWLQVTRELEHHPAAPGRDTSRSGACPHALPHRQAIPIAFIFPNDQRPFEK